MQLAFVLISGAMTVGARDLQFVCFPMRLHAVPVSEGYL